MLIDDLIAAQKKVAEIQRRIDNCQHEYGEPYVNPETYQKGTIVGYRPRGSDPEPIMNYHDAIRVRWSRKCRKCGKEEHTYHTKPVTFTPDFANKGGPKYEL